jgi:DNA polymerase elongation subunit (family B)
MEHAEAITVSGQLSIRWIEKKFNEYLNDMFGTDEDYVIAIDTDSAYVTFKRIIDPEKSTEENVEFLNEFVEKTIDPLFEKWYQELADYTNAYAQKMVMKREVIADKGIWVAKKHYALNVWDLEGNRFTDQSQLKIMGIESVRSSTPKVCRVAINSALRIMLNENEARLIEFIANFRKEFFDLPFEDIAFPRGVSDITKWCDKYQNTLQVKKGCPIHVRGSITYNNLINDKNLVNQYDYVRNGDKIKFSYLKLPNPAREHVIACPKTLPKQFGLDKYVDYDKQFQKSFLEPIESIAHSAGLKTEIIATLEDFWK